ncbi:hypothetical protein F1643_00960 [Azospirillum sp. INR13]|uniref:hypothetical protein n=1 Tax=Azospirillum sp. INR13 TaxID=2596919 RepID=UPI0018925263|nr:hypothetical protein [Azospirillum sp. INR13]MBF5093247.1 hypothetical protein [Azospirillum sp. INR13]
MLSVDNFVVLDLFDVAGHRRDPAAGDGGAGPAARLLRHPHHPAGAPYPAGHPAQPDPDCFRTEGHRQETIRFCKDLAVVNDNAPAVAEGLRGVE